VLLGRRSESEALDRLLETVRGGESRVLVVRGEPGVGKSALLEYVAGRASGCRVARAAGGGDGSVLLWHATGELLGEFANPAGWARTVAIDMPGARVAIGSGIGDICVRDVVGDRFTAHLVGDTGRILFLGFTHHPDRLVSGAADGTVRIWSLSHLGQIAEVRTDASLFCGAFDPTAAVSWRAVPPVSWRWGSTAVGHQVD
jgi:hypothetical protein